MSMRPIGHFPFGEPDFRNLAISTPQKLYKGEVLVRVHSSGVNPVETYIWKQSEYYSNESFVVGLDAAGIVEEVGEDVTVFKKGDRVYVVMSMIRACAEYIVCNVRNVALLSEKLSFDQGASLGIPCFTAYKALYILGRARPGETVLIHGASSGIGTAAVQIAVAKGHRVFGAVGSEKELELVKKLGAEQVFNHTDQGYMDKILEATGGKGVDVIVEMLADANLDKDLDIVAFKGRVVVVGSKGTTDFDPRKMMVKEAKVVGVNLFKLTSETEWNEIKTAVYDGQKSGWLVPVVSKEQVM